MELQLIQNKIYQLHGNRIMLDYDLAKLYEAEARTGFKQKGRVK